MPIHEYECTRCGHCFEKLMFAGDDDRDPRCPACGTPGVRKRVNCADALSASGGGLCTGAGPSRFS